MRKLGLHLSVEYKILASDVITASYQRMFLYFKLFKAVVHTVPRYSSFECRSCPPFPLHDGILGLLIIVLDFLREGCILGFTSPLTSLHSSEDGAPYEQTNTHAFISWNDLCAERHT